MNISGINSSPAALQKQSADKTLDTACHEFEGLLLGTIFKQGIVPQHEEDEEQETSNNSLFTEFAAEQTARALSGSDATGIAAQLRRQMTNPGA